jgi:hypothetical protein
MRFCAHLERYSLNIHLSETRFEKWLQGKLKHTFYVQQGRETDHSRPSSVELNGGAACILSLRHTFSSRGA